MLGTLCFVLSVTICHVTFYITLCYTFSVSFLDYPSVPYLVTEMTSTFCVDSMASMSGSGSLGSDGEGDDIGLPNNQEKKGKRTQAERQKEYRKRTKQSEEEVRRKLEDATQKLEDATHELRAMREVYEQMREQNETALARQRELQGELEAVVKQRDRAIRERDDARRECTSLEEEMDSMLKNAGKCEECGRDI
jgi:chromosome segregation ATPase